MEVKIMASRQKSQTIPKATNDTIEQVIQGVFPAYKIEDGNEKLVALLKAIRSKKAFDRTVGDAVAAQCGSSAIYRFDDNGFTLSQSFTGSGVTLIRAGQFITIDLVMDTEAYQLRMKDFVEPLVPKDEAAELDDDLDDEPANVSVDSNLVVA